MSDDLIIHVNYTGAPIPTREIDWAAYVDGDEERGSCMGATPWEALRDLADRLEDAAEREQKPECPACGSDHCICDYLRTDMGMDHIMNLNADMWRRYHGLRSMLATRTERAMETLACESLLETSNANLHTTRIRPRGRPVSHAV